MAYDQPGTPAGEQREKKREEWGEAEGKNFFGGGGVGGSQNGREDLRGVGRSNKEREVKSLIASAIGPCAGIECGAGEEALTLDLRG